MVHTVIINLFFEPHIHWFPFFFNFLAYLIRVEINIFCTVSLEVIYKTVTVRPSELSGKGIYLWNGSYKIHIIRIPDTLSNLLHYLAFSPAHFFSFSLTLFPFERGTLPWSIAILLSSVKSEGSVISMYHTNADFLSSPPLPNVNHNSRNSVASYTTN